MMICIALITLLLLPTSSNNALAMQLMIEPPNKEKLVYNISWEGFLKVGTGTISIKKCEGPYLLKMTAHSARLFDFFFKVRDFFKSEVRPDFSSFTYYEKRIQEGRYKRHDRVWYHPETGKIAYEKNGVQKPSLSAPPPLFDPLSVLHAYRFLCPKDGNCSLTATDGKHIDRLKVIKLGEEAIRIHGKRYITIKVQPVWKRMQGVFRKKKGGHVYVWFERRPPYRPLKMEAAIFIGKVVATLVEVEGD